MASSMALTDKNLFAYCGNNPINRKDINGNFWVAALVGAAVNVVTTAVVDGVYGTAYNTISSATYKGVTNNAQIRNKKIIIAIVY